MSRDALVTCLTVGEAQNPGPMQDDGWRDGVGPAGPAHDAASPTSAPPAAPVSAPPGWAGGEQQTAALPYPAAAYPSEPTSYESAAYGPQAQPYPQPPYPSQPAYGAVQPGALPPQEARTAQGAADVAGTLGQSTPTHPVSGGPSSYYGAGAEQESSFGGAPSVPSSRPAYEDAIDPLASGGANWQRRIVPSPPEKKGRLLIGLALGLLAGLLVFGATGYFVGRQTAPGAKPNTGRTVQPSRSLPPFEQSQLTLNRPKFTPELLKLAETWLPWTGGCVKNGDQDGLALNTGEITKVWCKLGALNIYFVAYGSIAERDKARFRASAQNLDALSLTPGVEPAGTRTTPSGQSSGNYIEYAYRAGTGASGRTVGGLWWDDADAPVSAYIRGYWIEAMGESWEPVRDLWHRYS